MSTDPTNDDWRQARHNLGAPFLYCPRCEQPMPMAYLASAFTFMYPSGEAWSEECPRCGTTVGLTLTVDSVTPALNPDEHPRPRSEWDVMLRGTMRPDYRVTLRDRRRDERAAPS